jgi:hypothetical protein
VKCMRRVQSTHCPVSIDDKFCHSPRRGRICSNAKTLWLIYVRSQWPGHSMRVLQWRIRDTQSADSRITNALSMIVQREDCGRWRRPQTFRCTGLSSVSTIGINVSLPVPHGGKTCTSASSGSASTPIGE